MIYDVNGSSVNVGYNVNGQVANTLYDVTGDVLDDDPIVTPLTWNMTDAYKSQVLSVLNYIRQYKASHSNSYAICQFNDVHNNVTGNEPNFIDYNKGYKNLSAMLFLGDMVSLYTASEAALASGFIQGAQISPRIVCIGNHEYYGDTQQQSTDAAEAAFESYINVNVVKMYPNDAEVIYYYDDTENNVRYIILNPHSTGKTANSRDFDDAQMKWCAGVIQSAGSKDIIIGNHYYISPFTCIESQEVVDSGTPRSMSKVVDLLTAFKNRTTYTIDGDTFNFSSCTGNVVMLTSGHYHAFGFSNSPGFPMFTCPNLGSSVWGGGHKGFTFFIIDKTLRTIKAIQCSTELSNYIDYDCTY